MSAELYPYYEIKHSEILFIQAITTNVDQLTFGLANPKDSVPWVGSDKSQGLNQHKVNRNLIIPDLQFLNVGLRVLGPGLKHLLQDHMSSS